MKKLLAIITGLFLVTGFAAAQTSDTPTNGDQPGDVQPSTEGPNATIPSLPSQASDVAKQVTNTINQFLGDPGQVLGDALQALVGDGGAGTEPGGNQTEG